MAIVSQPANKNYRENFDQVFKKTAPPSTDFPRRNRADQWSIPEHAIYTAAQAVERMPADIRLTEAVMFLQRAQGKVADFIDGIGRCVNPGCTNQALPNKSACSDHDRVFISPYPAE